MAPEQFADPRSADHRCDIYAFGAVVFEMLAGYRPFAGPTLARFHRQHCRYDPPSLVPAISKPTANMQRLSTISCCVA